MARNVIEPLNSVNEQNINPILETVARVGEDGTIHVILPPAFAGTDVLVTVTAFDGAARNANIPREDWHAFVKRTYGCLADVEGFEEPVDLPPQERDWS